MIMRSSLTMKVKQGCAAAAFAALGILLTGCGHLAYTDPNPSTPYAFPGQPMNRAAASPSWPASVSGAPQVTPYPPGTSVPTPPPAVAQSGLDAVGRPPAVLPGPVPEPSGTIRVFRVNDLV